DKRDAYWIAKALQTGMTPHPVYIPDGNIRELRRLLARRRMITRDRTRWQYRWTDRTLELGPDALTIGARRIPWHAVRTVRRVVTNGQTTGVEIVQEDGARVTLQLDYGRPLDELARLIEAAWGGT